MLLVVLWCCADPSRVTATVHVYNSRSDTFVTWTINISLTDYDRCLCPTSKQNSQLINKVYGICSCFQTNFQTNRFIYKQIYFTNIAQAVTCLRRWLSLIMSVDQMKNACVDEQTEQTVLLNISSPNMSLQLRGHSDLTPCSCLCSKSNSFKFKLSSCECKAGKRKAWGHWLPFVFGREVETFGCKETSKNKSPF